MILLRKGPEDIPPTNIVLFFSCGLLIFAFACSALLLPDADRGSLALSFLVAVLSYLAYWFVLLVTGFARRLVPTIASIMACGSLLTVLQIMVFAIMSPVFSDSISVTVAWLILIWAIPVKGNIIARAIEQHWYIGIVIAMSIFVLQNLVYADLLGRSAG